MLYRNSSWKDYKCHKNTKKFAVPSTDVGVRILNNNYFKNINQRILSAIKYWKLIFFLISISGDWNFWTCSCMNFPILNPRKKSPSYQLHLFTSWEMKWHLFIILDIMDAPKVKTKGERRCCFPEIRQNCQEELMEN